jgi:hypothetical protein
MEEYNPPIHTREDDELIIIAGSSTDDWQQDAIDQAKAELERREIFALEQQQRFNELKNEAEQEWNDELELRRIEDYHWFHKIIIVCFWYYALFMDWGLRREGYKLKAKHRLQLIGLGIGIYGILFSWSYRDYKIEEQKRLEEIERIDISKWEKDRLPYDTVEKNKAEKKDTISK